MSDYEIERKKYLLFEDDVVTCIYKKVQVSSDASKSGESSSETIVEEDNAEQPSDELTDDTTTSLSADDIA